jgi:CheY-like chemotaxis protein
MATVFICDDHREVCEVLGRLFRKIGHRAQCAFGARELLTLLDLAPRAEPTVILLDLMMPDFNGVDCLRVIRANPATRNLPVFIYSALADGPLVDAARAAGATDTILKTITFDDLAARLTPYLGSTAPLDP